MIFSFGSKLSVFHNTSVLLTSGCKMLSTLYQKANKITEFMKHCCYATPTLSGGINDQFHCLIMANA